MRELTAQLQVALGQARVADGQAGARLKHAQAMKTAREAMTQDGQGAPQVPPLGLNEPQAQ
jgi:hypothetical protein